MQPADPVTEALNALRTSVESLIKDHAETQQKLEAAQRQMEALKAQVDKAIAPPAPAKTA